jgi:hypothetical protein
LSQSIRIRPCFCAPKSDQISLGKVSSVPDSCLRGVGETTMSAEESKIAEADKGAVGPVSEDGSKPPPVYVPPRIDPDFYQADVPDWCPDQQGEASSCFLPPSSCFLPPSSCFFGAPLPPNPSLHSCTPALLHSYTPQTPSLQQTTPSSACRARASTLHGTAQTPKSEVRYYHIALPQYHIGHPTYESEWECARHGLEQSTY